MKTQNNTRNKSEYEDLDEISSATTQRGQKTWLCSLGQQPHKFSSDTAIHVAPEKIHSKKLSEQFLDRSTITGSIPCFFRLGTNVSSVLLNGNDKDINSFEQTVKVPKLIRKHTLWLICYIFFYGLYLVCGALCFQLIETSEELKAHKKFNDLRIDFLKKYPQINEKDLDSILSATVSATNVGIKIPTNATSLAELNWNFGDLILFTTSMVTTIGYGHLSPITNAGKAFCIIYATIGIPLTLVLLSIMVEHLLKQSNKLLRVLVTRFRPAYKIVNIQILHLSILAAIFLILFLLIPAVIFASIESDWSALDGFYFCFTSLTTIGLGDIVPDANDSLTYGSFYKIITAIYLIIGLIAIMLVVTVFYTIPQLNIGVWLSESSSPTVELENSSRQKPMVKCHNKVNLPQITIDSKNSSSKTIRTIL